MSDRERVEMFKPVARFIAAVCGPRCGVELHYLNDTEHSLIAVENGAITGSQVGDGLMDCALEALMGDVNAGREYSMNIPGKARADGADMRCASYFIKDDAQRLIGLMSVTVDAAELSGAQGIIDKGLFCAAGGTDGHEDDGPPISAADMVNAAFKKAMALLCLTDVTMLRKDDKLKIISMMDEKNLFALRGAVGLTAKLMRISEPSVYRYIHEHNKKEAKA